MGERPTRRAVLAAGGMGATAALAGYTSRASDLTKGVGARTHEMDTSTKEPMGAVEFSIVLEAFVGRFRFPANVTATLDELEVVSFDPGVLDRQHRLFDRGQGVDLVHEDRIQ